MQLLRRFGDQSLPPANSISYIIFQTYVLHIFSLPAASFVTLDLHLMQICLTSTDFTYKYVTTGISKAYMSQIFSHFSTDILSCVASTSYWYLHKCTSCSLLSPSLVPCVYMQYMLLTLRVSSMCLPCWDAMSACLQCLQCLQCLARLGCLRGSLLSSLSLSRGICRAVIFLAQAHAVIPKLKPTEEFPFLTCWKWHVQTWPQGDE